MSQQELHMAEVLDRISDLLREVDGVKEVWCQVDSGKAAFPPAAINTWPAALVFFDRAVDYSLVGGIERDEYIVSVDVMAAPASNQMGEAGRLAVQLRQRILSKFAVNLTLGGLCTICEALPAEGMRRFPYAGVEFLGIRMEFSIVEEAITTPATGV